jgi:hypothetical protein
MSQRTDTSPKAAESVRAACLDTAIRAYEDAGIRGLCADGRWEAALAAIRQLDLTGLVERPDESATCRSKALAVRRTPSLGSDKKGTTGGRSVQRARSGLISRATIGGYTSCERLIGRATASTLTNAAGGFE